ncbi:MAG: hypothetical protein OXD37_07325 [Acidimicrobiaceae bacterium]|nr:hypothetical protein [Acidimicrobiaceae bacterium]
MTEADNVHRQRPSLSLGGDDWPAAAADKVVEAVGWLRAQTTDRAVLVIRATVYSLLLAVAVISAVTMLAVATVRLADAYLPIGAGVGSATWAAHGFVGLLVAVVGFGMWGARNGSAKPFYAALLVDAAVVVAVVFYGVIAALA